MLSYVFGPPGSGSESISQRYGSAKIEKNLDSYYFVTLLSLKNDVNVPSKSKQKYMEKQFFCWRLRDSEIGVLKLTDIKKGSNISMQ